MVVCGVATAALLAMIGGNALQPASAAAPVRIGVSTVIYDSPGGTVSAIVTAYEVPADQQVKIWATGTGGATVACVGAVWRNPVGRTASRMCYLQLPNKAGSYNVRGSVQLTKGTAVRVVSGNGTRPVIADGVASPDPMPLERIRQIERCFNETSDVRLTFDDSGSAAQVDSILATLARNDVRGHFFFRGDWARNNPTLMERITTAGHVIGNHTSTHPPLSRAGVANILDQIDKGTAATGTPKLLRPPFGAGAFTTRVQKYAAARGYSLCRWTTDTYDWEGPSLQTMVERVKYGDAKSAPIEAGGNILMHGHGRNTAAGLQAIIDTVRAKGLSLERLTA